jgi:hypothetical protein
MERAWAELRAHSGSQFDAEIVEVFAQVVDDEGRLRSLDPAVESSLTNEAHMAMATEELHARLAMLPVLEPRSVLSEPAEDPCPVSPDGEDCAVIASGEGCEATVGGGSSEQQSQVA